MYIGPATFDPGQGIDVTFVVASAFTYVPAKQTDNSPVLVSNIRYKVTPHAVGIQRWRFKIDKSLEGGGFMGERFAVCSVYLDDIFQATVDCNYYITGGSFDNLFGGNVSFFAQYFDSSVHIKNISLVDDISGNVLFESDCLNIDDFLTAQNATIHPYGYLRLKSDGMFGTSVVTTSVALPEKFTISVDIYLDSLPEFIGVNEGFGISAFTTQWCFLAIFNASTLKIIKGSGGSGFSTFTGIDGAQGEMVLDDPFIEFVSTCTLTITTNPDPGDTLVLKGGQQGDITFTFVDHYPNNQYEIQIGADTSETASNIATAINNYTLAEFSAEASTNTVTVTSYISGEMTVEITGTGISAGTITGTYPGFNDEEISVADSFTVAEGGKSVQENASASDSMDGLIDGLTETVSASAVIDCLMDSMDENANASAASDNFDGLIDYMGDET